MIPQSQQRKKRNSSKVNLAISFSFHALLVGVMLYFAARQGWLGKNIQKLSVDIVKEKPKEKPKEPEKPKPPSAEGRTAQNGRSAQDRRGAQSRRAAGVAPPVVAPPVADVPAFEFEGGKAVETSSDPVQLYKGYLEYVLRQKWNRPDNMSDDSYVAEVQVNVDKDGAIGNPVWEKGSGNAKWDQSVKDVFKEVTMIDRRPPTNFPPMVTIRFDVQEETEPVLQ